MRHILISIFAATVLCLPLAAQAGHHNDVIVGSILGGATGAVIGNRIGGRDGAIIGGAIGAAAGVSIATDDNRDQNNYGRDDRRYRGGSYNSNYNNGYGDSHYDDDRRYNRYEDDHRYSQPYRGPREVVVVESPRHYYRGNDFVYGVPPREDYSRYEYADRGYSHSHDHQVIIIQQSQYRDEGRYCPPPRRW